MIAKRLVLTFKVIEVEYEEGEDWCDKLDAITSEKDYLFDSWNGRSPEYVNQCIEWHIGRWVGDSMGL